MTRGSGWLILFVLPLAALSGLLLSWGYVPAQEAAYPSIVELEAATLAGRFLRALHALSTHAAIALLLVHWGAAVIQPGAALADRPWGSGLLAMLLLVALAFSGRVLPWDEHAGISLTVATSWFRLEHLLRGPALMRVLLFHILAAGLLALALQAHVPWRERLAALREERTRSAVIAVAIGLLVCILGASMLWQAPLGHPYRAGSGWLDAPVAAEWYLRWLQALASRSVLLGQSILLGILAIGAVTPLLMRADRGRSVQRLWGAVLLLLVALSALPVVSR